MESRAVLENVLDPDLVAAGVDIADFHHPEAVERLLGRIERGAELPPFACCAEDLEAVRRHVAGPTNPENTLRMPALPMATQERRREPRRTVSRARNRAPASAEQPEHSSTRFLGVSAFVILIVAIIWQIGLWGVTAAYASYAADEAARAASVDSPTTKVRDDALRSVPSWFRTNTEVSQTTLGTVKVTSSMPVITPIFTVDGLDLTSEAPIVAEDNT
jgi:hypothetical protein